MGLNEFLVVTRVYFETVVFPILQDMFFVTLQKRETLEILIPLLITLFLVQMYFGRNKDERIGWNSAYANCIVLLFVTAHLANYVYETYGLTGLNNTGSVAYYKTLLVVILALVTISLMFIDFFHSINERFSFLMSSSIFITVISFVAIVLTYSEIPLTPGVLAASFFLLVIVSMFFKVFRWLIPPSLRAERYLEKKKEERIKKVKTVKHQVIIRKNRIERELSVIEQFITHTKRKVKNFFGGAFKK